MGRATSTSPRSRGSSARQATGDVEVEIFNQAIWDADLLAVARRTTRAFAASVGLEDLELAVDCGEPLALGSWP
jgi:hypothetical protein